MPAPEDLETLQNKLRKRGFRQDDLFLHECAACKENAVVIFAISGRSGGRDIRICQACGDANAWTAGAGMDGRVQDETFDLRTFAR
ncbi:hypothetical protein BH11MYX1_BH11MYX1_52700 [soil metagenome]